MRDCINHGIINMACECCYQHQVSLSSKSSVAIIFSTLNLVLILIDANPVVGSEDNCALVLRQCQIRILS